VVAERLRQPSEQVTDPTLIGDERQAPIDDPAPQATRDRRIARQRAHPGQRVWHPIRLTVAFAPAREHPALGVAGSHQPGTREATEMPRGGDEICLVPRAGRVVVDLLQQELEAAVVVLVQPMSGRGAEALGQPGEEAGAVRHELAPPVVVQVGGGNPGPGRDLADHRPFPVTAVDARDAREA
jgi:hypothetical protein